MYYLLEDNRIIDENNDFVKIYHKCKDKGEITCNEFDFVNEIFFSKVKLYGENVFDLIEVGDLVKYNYGMICNSRWNIYDICDVKSPTLEEKNSVYVRGFGLNYESIVAIYKPNKNGDYIKVWESNE